MWTPILLILDLFILRKLRVLQEEKRIEEFNWFYGPKSPGNPLYDPDLEALYDSEINIPEPIKSAPTPKPEPEKYSDKFWDEYLCEMEIERISENPDRIYSYEMSPFERKEHLPVHHITVDGHYLEPLNKTDLKTFKGLIFEAQQDGIYKGKPYDEWEVHKDWFLLLGYSPTAAARLTDLGTHPGSVKPKSQRKSS